MLAAVYAKVAKVVREGLVDTLDVVANYVSLVALTQTINQTIMSRNHRFRFRFDSRGIFIIANCNSDCPLVSVETVIS